MGVIWTNKTRTKQPQLPVGAAHGFGTVGLFSPGINRFDTVTGLHLSSVSGTVGSEVGTFGRAIGLRASNSSIYGTALARQKPSNTASIVWVGDLSSGHSNGAALGGVTYDDANAAPYVGFELKRINTPSDLLYLTWSDGGSFHTLASVTNYTTSPVVIVATIQNGQQTLYIRSTAGLEIVTATNAITAFEYASTARVEIGDSLNARIPSAACAMMALAGVAWSDAQARSIVANPWQLFAPERRPLFFDLDAGGSTVTGAGSSDGVGTVSGVGASTSAQVGSSAGVGAASGVGASTAASIGSSSGTGAADGVGSSTGGSDGVGASTGTGTATGVGASTAASLGSTAGVGAGSGVGASTAASVGSASGTGTASGVGTNGSIVSTGVGSASGTGTATGISPTVSRGGGKTTGKNLSRKQKKKLKAVESQEWLKAEETARQLLSDRFTKQTPQEKAQALETHIESLAPVIEALKAITDQIEGVQETVQETKTEELTEHKQILNKFDALITKMTSIEELLIIMLAQ